jgi:hypothetical protein
MALFLSEEIMHKFLLREADDDTYDPTSDDAETDTDDMGADEKDVTSDSADIESDKSEEDSEEETASDDESSDTDTESPDTDTESPDVAPKRKPSKFAIKVEDTPQNRLFLFNKFEEMIALHSSLKQFVENIMTSADLTEKQKEILEQLRNKINANIQMLEQLSDDDLYTGLDIADIFGLYKIYYMDVKNANIVIKSLMRANPKKNDRKG